MIMRSGTEDEGTEDRLYACVKLLHNKNIKIIFASDI